MKPTSNLLSKKESVKPITSKFEEVTLGSDPEFFLFCEKENRFVSSEGRIQGGKHSPTYIPELGDMVTKQCDNIMGEVTCTPTNSPKEMFEQFQAIFKHIEDETGCKVVLQASANIDKDLLQSEQAKEFGCDPDFNPYTKGQNPMPTSPGGTLRTCGGHIHVGFKLHEDVDSRTYAICDFLMYMDMFLGLPALLMDPDTDRKKMYGKAGAFRFKSYGCEYRVLSNFWLAKQELVDWVFRSVEKAINAFNEHGTMPKERQDKLMETISEAKVAEAPALIKELQELGFDIEIVV